MARSLPASALSAARLPPHSVVYGPYAYVVLIMGPLRVVLHAHTRAYTHSSSRQISRRSSAGSRAHNRAPEHTLDVRTPAPSPRSRLAQVSDPVPIYVRLGCGCSYTPAHNCKIQRRLRPVARGRLQRSERTVSLMSHADSETATHAHPYDASAAQLREWWTVSQEPGGYLRVLTAHGR